MRRLDVHPDHVLGLRYLLDAELYAACDSQDLDTLRDPIPAGDQLGWEHADPAPTAIDIPDRLFARFVDLAWEYGNEKLADFHRGEATGRSVLVDPARQTAEARSMLAFAETHGREAVA